MLGPQCGSLFFLRLCFFSRCRCRCYPFPSICFDDEHYRCTRPFGDRVNCLEFFFVIAGRCHYKSRVFGLVTVQLFRLLLPNPRFPQQAGWARNKISRLGKKEDRHPYPGMFDGRSMWMIDCRKFDDSDNDQCLRKHIGRNPRITKSILKSKTCCTTECIGSSRASTS